MTQITIDRAIVEQALETIEGLTRDRLFTAEWAGKHGATIAALRAALAQQADKPQRPKCFEFALDFLGTPENGELLAYIEQLEARAAMAQQAEPLALRLNDQLGLVGWKIDRNPDDTITIVSPSGSSAIVSRMAVWGAREIPEEVLYELAESLMA
jgi:hypothetical protein